MTTAAALSLSTRTWRRLPMLQRLASSAMVLLAFLTAWAFLVQQHSLLWARLPASAVNRFVADHLETPLPLLPPVRELGRVCAQPLSAWANWHPALLRREVAGCLGHPEGRLQGEAAEQATVHFKAMLAEQTAAANAWLAAFDTEATAQRRAMVQELTALQSQPAGLLAPLAWLGQRLALAAGLETATTTRQPVGRAEAEDRAAVALRGAMRATQSRMQALAGLPLANSLPGLALLATGRQLETDYGQAPPAVSLGTDRASLADALEWQRRAQGFATRGAKLASLQALPAALLASSWLLLLVVAAASRARALALALWALTSVLLGAGALVLTDLALTGEPSLRYLAERQFLRFGLGDCALPLTLSLPLGGGGTVDLWLPLLAVAGGLACMALLRDGQSLWLAPVRAWVSASARGRGSFLPMAMLLALGFGLVFMLGMPAAVSELLVLLGAIGLATYLARQAPLANVGGGLQTYNLGIVAMAGVCALGGAVWRGDLGHALVSLALAGTFVWMFGGTWLRWAVAALVLAGVAALAICLVQGGLVGPLAWLTEDVLPPHAQARMHAQFDAFHAAASDLARVRWLIQSAGFAGWGPGYVPWQGLAAVRVQDGLPLQGPSDYVLALTSALWGRVGGLALMTAVMLLFVVAATAGLRTALRLAMPPAVRWLTAVGGFGCLLMAFKVVLSVGGVSGVLPLTGLPVALVGYGPVTHLAALLYLVLALGAYTLQPKENSRGVKLYEKVMPAGAVRRRGVGLALAGVAALASLTFMGERHLRNGVGESGAQHISQSRLELARALTGAMVAADVADSGNAGANPFARPCPELANAVDAWNGRLAALDRPVRLGTAEQAPVTRALRVDVSRLLSTLPTTGRGGCRRLARTLGQMLDSDLTRLVGTQASTALVAGGHQPATDAQRLSPFDKPRALGARPSDYTTANAWWVMPGCLFSAGEAISVDCFSPATATAKPLALAMLGSTRLTDAWLQRELASQLYTALRQPTAMRYVNQRAVAAGPALGLTLDARLQPLAQRVADCYTGRLAGADCDTVLPADADWRQRYFGASGAMRAASLGLVLVEVDSGRMLALAGSVSDCSLDQLGRSAQPDSQGRVSALRPGRPCAQLPDKRSAWLAQQHPALWMLPPGSSFKELAMVAGIDAGLIEPANDAYWKGILAESHERLPVQRVALAAGQRYLDVLAQVGYGASRLDLVWGGNDPWPAYAHLNARWATEAHAGARGLRATAMTLDEAERIRKEKLAGTNVDQRYGHAVMTEFVAARKVADAALGGGDVRVNAVGLAGMWAGLDLRARGLAEAPGLHLLEEPGHAVVRRPLTWASPLAAQRAMGITSGVTASAWKGTAQGSCRVVFGSCPAQGLPGLSGKTGTSDFLTEEEGQYVKPGMQIPAKLFGGVFTGPDGKRYAVAVTAQRVRQGGSGTLELTSSAPAEAALTLMRQMGVKTNP